MNFAITEMNDLDIKDLKKELNDCIRKINNARLVFEFEEVNIQKERRLRIINELKKKGFNIS